MAVNYEVFISGVFRGNLILGAAGTLSTLTSSPQDFIVKADANGNFSWAIMNDASSWWRTEVLADNNDVYMFGSFGTTMNLGATTLTTSQFSTYMTKIDNAGNYLWAKKYGTYETTFYTATKKNNKIYLCGRSSELYPSNQFDTLNLIYLNSLSAANTYNTINYLIQTDLNGNAIKGAIYSLNFPTFITQNITASNTKTYLTGNALGIASFGGTVIDPAVSNSANYVAIYSDSANIINGTSFYDLNSNGILDGGDVNCTAKLILTKGSVSQTSMTNGFYKVGTDKGTYVSTITDAPLYYTYTPNSYTSTFTNLSHQIDSLNDFAFQPIPGQNDLVIDMVLGQLRPGFSGTGFVTLKNIGTTSKTGTINVQLNHPDITINSCNPSAITIVGNTASLAYNLTPTQEITYSINYYVAPTAILSSNVLGTAAALDATDLTPLNNVDTVGSIVTGSYDPNNKLVFPSGDVSPTFIANGTALEYIVNFQNTGTDTAFVVVIRDTISSLLNLSTFNLISSSHPVQIDFYGNEVWFRFYNILLVDSTTNEPLSHGFVKYSIVPKSTCVLGNEIENTAYIYFDYNSPIITNTTNTTIAQVLAISENKTDSRVIVFPNPSSEDLVQVKSNSVIESVGIYTPNGQLIKEEVGLTSKQISISTEGLTDGIYFIKVKSGNETSTHKLIKLK